MGKKLSLLRFRQHKLVSHPGRKPLAFEAKALAVGVRPEKWVSPTEVDGVATTMLNDHHPKMLISAGYRRRIHSTRHA